MSLKLKVWNIGTEGMEYVSVFNLKMPSGMHVIVKDVLVITYLAVEVLLYVHRNCRLIRDGSPDGHLDFHTASELCLQVINCYHSFAW